MPAEVPHVVKRPFERLLRVLQLLHVRQKPARLDRVPEAGRRLLSPFLERFGRGPPVEGVVDLDRVEDTRVLREPAPCRELSRIEITAREYGRVSSHV
jgi:hypothetical protein